MKSMRGFIIAIIALFALMMLIEANSPRHFKWTTSFAHADDQPFGCALFDSVMSASLPQGYTTTQESVYQLFTSMPSDERHVYLIITDDYVFLSEAEASAIMQFLERGDQIIISAPSLDCDSLNKVFRFKTNGYAYVSLSELKSNILGEIDYDTLTWYPIVFPHDTKKWIIPAGLGYSNIQTSSYNVFKPILTHPKIIVEYDKEVDDFIEYEVKDLLDTIIGISQYKNGQIIIAGNPLMYTNYGVIELDASSLMLRLLSQLERYPVIRIDLKARTKAGGINTSPLRYVLSQAPLRWAIYLFVSVIAFALIFTARRRQRVIPVVTSPANRTMEMVKHIGSLYFQRHDNADLLAKKYQYFVEQVRKLSMIDLEDESRIEDAYIQLHHATGISSEELKSNLENIVAWTGAQPSDHTLIRSIDFMNMILNKLKI